MAWWNRRGDRNDPSGETPNANGPATFDPGDPDGLEIIGERVVARSLPFPAPSPWDGWPGEWATPGWGATGSHPTLSKLIDTAWAAIDLNASVLSSFPVYRLRNGEVLSPPAWMINPDDSTYTCWAEFIKQVFWDYQLGEVFILSMANGADTYPLSMRVVPPWLINVELRGGSRQYMMGGRDVTRDILHIRNISNTADAHGHSPLEAAGARIITAGLLQRYAHKLAETGGVPLYWLGVDRTLDSTQANDLLTQWVESRTQRAGEPALLSGGATLNQMQAMSARDMTLMEVSQFTEARIAVLCKVPPFLIGLPMAQGESLTYSNASSLFDYHDRSGLRPMANAVMEALSGWALPRGQSVELNRDEYSRPGYLERAQANQIYLQTGVLSRDEVRAMERFTGPGPSGTAVAALTGAELTSGGPSTSAPAPTVPAQQEGT